MIQENEGGSDMPVVVIGILCLIIMFLIIKPKSNNQKMTVGNNSVGISAKGSITQNGSNNQFSVSGNSISVIDGVLVVDGKRIHNGLNDCQVTIIVEGGCETVKTDNGSITVNGDVSKNVSTSNGSIKVTNGVGGDASTTNGSIKVGGEIHGNASTVMGKIISK